MKKKNETPVDMQTALDCAVRDYERTLRKENEGYVIKDTMYCNYICNQDWDEFLKKMKPCHRKQFDNGSGGELKAGNYPPKMASFGSSSRMIYVLSKGVLGFIFEKKLDTHVGGYAHLDGFLNRGNDYIYIEAKKREIYEDSHESQDINRIYESVYKIIEKECPDFSLKSNPCKSKKGKDKNMISFYLKEKPVNYFDLKQLICHFLGITYDIAKHHVPKVNVTFLYLLYNPEEVKKDINELYRTQVMDRYKNVKEFIENNIELFKRIFDVVLQYQTETNNLEKPNINFDFKLVDQDKYESELK